MKALVTSLMIASLALTACAPGSGGENKNNDSGKTNSTGGGSGSGNGTGSGTGTITPSDAPSLAQNPWCGVHVTDNGKVIERAVFSPNGTAVLTLFRQNPDGSRGEKVDQTVLSWRQEGNLLTLTDGEQTQRMTVAFVQENGHSVLIVNNPEVQKPWSAVPCE